MSLGVVSGDEFESLAQQFVATSRKIDDGWQLEKLTNAVYMWKKFVSQTQDIFLSDPSMNKYEESRQRNKNLDAGFEASDRQLTSDNLNENIDELSEEMEMEEEDAQCMQCGAPTPDVLTREYHVVYSESYSVPVLYFNIYSKDGKLLPLTEVWERCPATFQKHLELNKWSTLTQQEHPLLGRPFLQLHPCHTADLMSQVLKHASHHTRKNYLAIWLSTVGPMVGLAVPHDYMV